jgi:HAMP domain-containing protein
VPIVLDGTQAATLQIVSPLAPVRVEALEAAWVVAAAAGLSLLLGGILLTASLWRALSPLGSLAAAARATELRSVGERVEVPDTDDEVGLLAAEFNTMLDRLDAAAAAQDSSWRPSGTSCGPPSRSPAATSRCCGSSTVTTRPPSRDVSPSSRTSSGGWRGSSTT